MRRMRGLMTSSTRPSVAEAALRARPRTTSLLSALKSSIDGVMVDKPHLTQALRTLDAAH